LIQTIYGTPTFERGAAVVREVCHLKATTFRWRERRRSWLGIFWKTIAEGTCDISDLSTGIAEKARAVANDPMWSCYVDWPFSHAG